MKILRFSILPFALLLFKSNASAQLKIGDQPTVIEKSVALDVKGSNGQQGLWLPRVADSSVTGIRALNPPDGLLIYHTTSGKILLRSNNAWIASLQSAIESITVGVTTLTGPAITYNTGTAGTDFGIATSGNTITWNLPDASVTARGAVTTGAQTFGGIKYFNDYLFSMGGSRLDGGTIVNNGLSVTLATGNASNLTLGITSATTPGASASKFLTVDGAGRVTLNTAANTIVTKKFTSEMDATPKTILAGSSSLCTFSIAGAGLSSNSTVHISPVVDLSSGTIINWVRVLDATTIQMSVSSVGTNQVFVAGLGNSGTFKITVIEF